MFNTDSFLFISKTFYKYGLANITYEYSSNLCWRHWLKNEH